MSADVHFVKSAERLLTVSDLAVEYRGGDGRRREIVTDLNMEVAQGETVGIVGESGSGKSLSARAMMRLLPPGVYASGSIVYRGTDLFRLSERQMAKVRGSSIAMLLQDPFTMLNPLLRSGMHIEEVLRTRAAGGSAAAPGGPRPCAGSPRSGSPTRPCSTGTRSSSRAECGSASRWPPRSRRIRTS